MDPTYAILKGMVDNGQLVEVARTTSRNASTPDVRVTHDCKNRKSGQAFAYMHSFSDPCPICEKGRVQQAIEVDDRTYCGTLRTRP